MAQAPQDLNCYLMQRPVAAALATPRSFVDHTRCYARVLDHSYPEAKLHLTGFSYVGAEAFETARQLAALGSAPAGLTVIDHGPVFRRQWPVDPTWGGEAIRAEKRRRAHVFTPWAALVADQLALDMGKECTDMLADWIKTADLLPPKGVPALAWHGARAQALLRLQNPQAALTEVEIARLRQHSFGR
jgi:thioesterase domain-containing protein